MNLVWHELLLEEESPDFPEELEELVFYIFETNDVFCGYYCEGVFYTHNPVECDRCYQAVGCSGLRIAWAYLDMSQVGKNIMDYADGMIKAMTEMDKNNNQGHQHDQQATPTLVTDSS